jgi:hypothetical protein
VTIRRRLDQIEAALRRRDRQATGTTPDRGVFEDIEVFANALSGTGPPPSWLTAEEWRDCQEQVADVRAAWDEMSEWVEPLGRELTDEGGEP